MQWLTNLWWVHLPRLFRRVAVTPALALTDGLYITALPSVAAFLSPIIFLLGMLFGWLHPGFQMVFSESLPLLLLATLLGVLSGHLGMMFLAGFAVGDYFLFNPVWMFLEGSIFLNILYRFALVIEYVLLGMLTTQIPLVTKALLGQFYFVARWGKAASFIVALIGHVFLTVLLVYLWGQAVPVLIRPALAWAGQDTQRAAMTILQQAIWPLLVAAALASVVRMALQGMIALTPALSERIVTTGEAITASDITPLTERLPRVIRAFFAAAWGALLLSGLYTPWFSLPDTLWIDGVLVGFVIFVLQLLRLDVIPVPIGVWSRLMAKVPLLIRLTVGALIMLGLGAAVLPLFWGPSFRPMLFLIIVGLVVFYLLNPASPTKDSVGQPSSA